MDLVRSESELNLHLDQFKGGFEYLLVVVDYFTKFNKYFLDFGFPKCILHDQGKEFDNKFVKRLSKITGVKPSRITSYHTMGNRLRKRMNQTLLNMLETLPTNFFLPKNRLEITHEKINF